MDVGPLTLSSITKELLELEELSSESPVALISKEQLLNDIRERPEESEFALYADYIQKYTDEDIAVVLDNGMQYGQPYFLCLSAEAKEDVLRKLNENVIKKVQDEMEEVNIDGDIDEQVIDESDQDTRAKIRILVFPRSGEERKPLILNDDLPSNKEEFYLEILPHTQYYGYDEDNVKSEVAVIRRTVDCGFQESISYSIGFSQTDICAVANASAQTELKLFTDEEKADIWGSTDMCTFLETAETRMSDVLIENACGGLDKPWVALQEKSDISLGRETPLTVVKSFICVGEHETRLISFVDWHPNQTGVFVSATTENCTLETYIDRMTHLLQVPCYFYIWNMEDQLSPRLLLDSCADTYCIRFNKTLPHLIAAGSIHGQIILWDISGHLDKLESITEHISIQKATKTHHGENESAKAAVMNYCALSNIDHSHVLGVTSLEWLRSGIEVYGKGEVRMIESSESYQLVSCGLDGFLRFWDLRHKEENVDFLSKKHVVLASPYEILDLTWKPFHIVEVPPSDGVKHLCLTTFELKNNSEVLYDEISHPGDDSKIKNQKLSSQKLSTLYFAGTEDGKVLCGDFKLVKNEVGKFIAQAPKYYTSIENLDMHRGPVSKIAHSPFLDDIFFSIGGNTMIVWKEDLLNGPLFVAVSKSSDITAGDWSRTRPSVFILGLSDGSIRVWDILQSGHGPVLLQSVAPSAITAITIHVLSEEKYILAVGDSDGFVHILNLPIYLWKPVDDEVNKLEQMLAREIKRVQAQITNYKAMISVMKVSDVKTLDDEKKHEKATELPQKVQISKADLYAEEYSLYLELKRKCLIKLGYMEESSEQEKTEDEDNSS